MSIPTGMEDIEGSWQGNLTSILNELDGGEYNKMLLFLSKIPKDSRKLDKGFMAELILQQYGLHGSLKAVEDALGKIPRNDAKIRQYLWRSLEDVRNPGRNQERTGIQGDQPGPSTKSIAYDEDFVYTLSGRREAFILCQKKDRDGAQEDKTIITKLLQKYSFDCTTKSDLRGEDILPAVRSFRDSLLYGGELACCFIVLMAHGGQDVIFGTDRQQVSLKEIFDLFNNKGCPKLIGKPKVFIVQACRGGGRDHGVEVAADDLPSEELAWAADSPITRRMPTVSDTLTICPTLPGNIALRNSAGSPLFLMMEEVFSQFDDKYHLVDLFTKVNQELVQKDYFLQKENKREDVKITLCIDSSFTKVLFLNKRY